MLPLAKAYLPLFDKVCHLFRCPLIGSLRGRERSALWGSQSLFGLSSRNRLAALWYPASVARSKSSFVHRSALMPESCAVLVRFEFGEQKTSIRSVEQARSPISIAMSVCNCFCHSACSVTNHLPLAGGNGTVGSGAVPLSSHCSLPSSQ